MVAAGEASWRLIAANGNTPQESLIAVFLVVDGNLYKGHSRAIGRNLRIANPIELKKVFFSDRTLLRKSQECDAKTKKYCGQPETTVHGSSFK
jgi:hypothetical protein